MVNAIPVRNLPVLSFAHHLPKPWTDRFAHVNGKRGVKGLLRDTWLSVFNFRERWKYEIKTCELWLVCLPWYVNFKIFYQIFMIFSYFFREIVSTEDKFYREASGPSNELFWKVLKNSKGLLFKRSLASGLQNRVLSHFQFFQRFYLNTGNGERFMTATG